LQLAGQPADVLAALVDLELLGQSRMREGVIVMVEQQADARRAGSGWESHVRAVGQKRLEARGEQEPGRGQQPDQCRLERFVCAQQHHQANCCQQSAHELLRALAMGQHPAA